MRKSQIWDGEGLSKILFKFPMEIFLVCSGSLILSVIPLSFRTSRTQKVPHLGHQATKIHGFFQLLSNRDTQKAVPSKLPTWRRVAAMTSLRWPGKGFGP